MRVLQRDGCVRSGSLGQFGLELLLLFGDLGGHFLPGGIQLGGQGIVRNGQDLGGQNGGAQTGPNGQQYYDADYKVVDDDENNKK